MPTASDILDQHVTLQYRSLDRLYLNLYVPYLMASGGVAQFLRRLGPIASPALFERRSRAFVTALREYYVCGSRRTRGKEACDQQYFRQPDVEEEVFKLLSAMSIPDGLAEAVDAAVKSYAGQERKSSRQSRKKSIDERLKRLGERYELGDVPKDEFLAKRNDLLIERDQLEAQPATASLTLQHQRIRSIVDDWPVMTDDEKKQVVQLIFAEVSADHTDQGVLVQVKPRPLWEPYVEAVLARQNRADPGSPVVTTSERKTGLGHPDAADFKLPVLVRGREENAPYPDPLTIVAAS